MSLHLTRTSLKNMSNKDLQQLCKTRNYNSNGDRNQLLENLFNSEKYTSTKSQIQHLSEFPVSYERINSNRPNPIEIYKKGDHETSPIKIQPSFSINPEIHHLPNSGDFNYNKYYCPKWISAPFTWMVLLWMFIYLTVDFI